MKRVFILIVLSSCLLQAMEQDTVFAAAQRVPGAVWERIIGYATTDVPTITGIMNFWKGLRSVIPQTKKCFRNEDGSLDKAKILNLYFKGSVEKERIDELAKLEKLLSPNNKCVMAQTILNLVIACSARTLMAAICTQDILEVGRYLRLATFIKKQTAENEPKIILSDDAGNIVDLVSPYLSLVPSVKSFHSYTIALLEKHLICIDDEKCKRTIDQDDKRDVKPKKELGEKRRMCWSSYCL